MKNTVGLSFGTFKVNSIPSSFLLLGLLGAFVSFSGCERKTSEEKTTLRFNIPEKPLMQATGSNPVLTHAVINVQTDETIVCNWDIKGSASGPCSFGLPASLVVSIDLKTNTSPFVQVLFVYETETSAGTATSAPSRTMTFAYGDNKATPITLTKATEDIGINLQTYGGVSTRQGNFQGRLVNGDNAGPSGLMTIKFKIPGVSSMTIFDRYIFSGWFETFMLQGIQFEYFLNGNLLFGQPMRLEDFEAYAANNAALVKTQSNSSNELQITGYYVQSGYTPSAGRYRACDTATCVSSGGAEYTDYLSTGANGGKSEFRGPFKKVNSNGGLLQFTSTSLSWAYLPGITSTILDGVRVFKMSNLTVDKLNTFRGNSDSWDCARISGNATDLGGALIAYPNTQLTFSSAQTLASTDALFVCPVVAGNLINEGVIMSSIWGGNGGNNSPVSEIKFFKYSWPPKAVPEYQCSVFRVQLLGANGSFPNNSSNISTEIYGNGSPAVFYTNSSDCMSMVNSQSTLIFNSGETFKDVYFKIPMQSSGPNFALSFMNLTSNPALSLTQTGITLPIRNSTSKALDIGGMNSMIVGSCYKTSLQIRDMYGYAFQVSSDTTVNLTTTGSVSVYSDAGCSTTISSAIIYSGTTSTTVWMKLNSNSPGLVSGTVAGYDDGELSVWSGGGTAAIAQIAVSGGQTNIYRDSCYGPFMVTLRNSSMNPVPATSNVSFSLSGTAGTYYSDSGCMTTLSSPTIAPTEYSKMFYYKASVATPNGVISPSSSGLTPFDLNLTINGPYKVSLVMAESNPVSNGMCVQLTVGVLDVAGNPTNLYVDQFFYLNNFPAGKLFTQRLNGNCMDPLPNPWITLPAYVNNKTLYFLATNPTSTTYSPSGYHSASSNLQNSLPLNIQISAPPILALSGVGFSNAALEYPFDLNVTIQKWTGVPTYSFSKTSGPGSVASNIYTPAGTGGVNFNIYDSNSNLIAPSLNIVARTVQADLTTGTLPTGFALSRSGSATYVDASGLVATATSNQPRYTHDPTPASGFPTKGLLIESNTTNYIYDTENLTGGMWSQNTTTTSVTLDLSINNPTGYPGSYYIDDQNPEPYNVGYLANTFTGDMINGKGYVLSAFIKKKTSRYAAMFIQENMVNTAGVVIDLDTGMTTAMTGPWTPQNVAAYGSEAYINGWYRVWVKYYSSGSSTGQGWVALIPAFSNNAGALTGNGEITATGSTYFWGLQVETSDAMTSYIPAGGGTASRYGDQLTWNGSYITGFINTQGTFKIDWTDVSGNNSSTSPILRLTDVIGDQYKVYYSANHTVNFSTYLLSSPQATVTTAMPIPKNAPVNKLCVSYDTGGLVIATNGDDYTTSQSMTSLALTTGSTYYIGSDGSGDALNGVLKHIDYWPYKFSGIGCAAVTK